jgi:phosphoribosyl 1,2-cyclic phosphodiesterase
MLMVDCGFSLKETVHRLRRLDVELTEIDGVLLTHEHTDHVRGAARVAARAGCPVWLTHGCLAMLEAQGEAPERVELLDGDAEVGIGDLLARTFPVPHDAREPVQYVLSDGRARLGMLTDVGHVTEHMVARLDGCDALVLECNHDIGLLRGGGYPPALKARILGRHGHLDNEAAAGLLGRLERARLRHVVAAHLSGENNTPSLARSALAGALDCAPEEIGVADQAGGLGWRDI